MFTFLRHDWASRLLIALLVTAVMLAGLLAIIKFCLSETGPDMLAFAVTADLLITVPVIWYLCIRRTRIPSLTVVPVAILGMLIGTLLIPATHQGYLHLFKQWVLPLLELVVLTYVIFKVRVAARTIRRHQSLAPDFFTALKHICAEMLPGRLAVLLATEIAVMYYGLLYWKRAKDRPGEYTYHRRSGTPALLGAVVGILALETFALHMLLASWSDLAAWIVTALSIYTAFQVFGFARSLSKRPILLTQDRLILRYGIMSEVEISLADISSAEQTRERLSSDKLTRKLSPLGHLESHNVVIRLKNARVLHGLYGARREFTTLALHVDRPQAFVTELRGCL